MQIFMPRSLLTVICLSLVIPISGAEPFRVVSYNLENYLLTSTDDRPVKSPAAQGRVQEAILLARPDVLAIQEIGGTNSLIQLQSSLKSRGMLLPYWTMVEGTDTN